MKPIPFRVPSRRRAFSLIELLTVIGIIGVLAAIGVGMSGVATRKSHETAVKAGLHKLQSAIDSYKADFNQYPPDFNNAGTNVNPALSPLYYELVGTIAGGQGNVYHAADRSDAQLTAAKIKTAFNAGGFLNSAVPPAAPKSFLQNLRERDRREIVLASGPAVELLLTPIDWPAALVARAPLQGLVAQNADLRFNPWHYVSTHPTNSPSSYDLWAEIPTLEYQVNPQSGAKQRYLKIRRIGNWGEEIIQTPAP